MKHMVPALFLALFALLTAAPLPAKDFVPRISTDEQSSCDVIGWSEAPVEDFYARPLVFDIVLRTPYSGSSPIFCDTLCRNAAYETDISFDCPMPMTSQGNYRSFWISIQDLTTGSTLLLFLTISQDGPVNTIYITSNNSAWTLSASSEPEEDILYITPPGSQQPTVIIDFNSMTSMMEVTLSQGFSFNRIRDCSITPVPLPLSTNMQTVPGVDATAPEFPEDYPATGIETAAVEPSIVNPFHDVLEINLQSAIHQPHDFTLLSMTGVPLARRRLAAGETHCVIPTGHLPSGMYVMSIKNQHGSMTRMILKI